MSADYSGLTRNTWPGTWSPTGTHPIALDTELRGSLQSISGGSGDKLTDIPGQRLQEGMVVYLKAGYTAGGYTRASDSYFSYRLLGGESRSAVTGAMPNAEGNWSVYATAGAQGAQGVQGFNGTQGAAGAQGNQGVQGANGSVNVTLSANPPGSPSYGDIWIDNATGTEYTYINDGDTNQWIELANVGYMGSPGAQGATGAQGAGGVQGAQGVQGATGSGAQGVQGAQGIQGALGVQGAQGVQGSQGSNGSNGSQGAQGAQGVQGALGAQGNVGSQGAQGVQGATGSGSQGVQGNQGYQGVQGTQGIQGAVGSQGVQGAQGVQGSIGAQGYQGAQGVQGFNGTQGAAGVQGAQGVQGFQGYQGSSPFINAIGFRATNPVTNLSINNGASAVIIYGTEEVDIGNIYNNSTGVFTPSIAGYYAVNWYATVTASGNGEFILILRKNGNDYAWGTNQVAATNGAANTSGHWSGQGGSVDMVYMNGSTDYLDVKLYNNSGGTVTINNYYAGYFSAHLIR